MKNSKGDPTELKLIRQNNENKIKNFKYAIFGFRIFCGLVQEQFQILNWIFSIGCICKNPEILPSYQSCDFPSKWQFRLQNQRFSVSPTSPWVFAVQNDPKYGPWSRLVQTNPYKSRLNIWVNNVNWNASQKYIKLSNWLCFYIFWDAYDFIWNCRKQTYYVPDEYYQSADVIHSGAGS